MKKECLIEKIKYYILTGIWLIVFLLAFRTGGNNKITCLAETVKESNETENSIPEELNNLYARSAVLMDGDSGRVLFGKNEEEVLAMASTTKILTCILALELGAPEEICRVSERAAAQPEVHLGMKEGERYYLKDLLYSMMLESHNDSAVCVAEHIGGSTKAFAELMNKKAKEIGCVNAHFVTANGLDGQDEGGEHRISVKELGMIMRYCILISEKREVFLEITSALSYKFQDVEGKRSFHCDNHNALLNTMEGALSGKTGFTNKAGYCYVGAVRQGEKTLIAAVLACGWPGNRNYKWADTRKMLEYGFAEFERKTLDLNKIVFPVFRVENGEKDTVAVALKNRKCGKQVLLARPEEKLYACMEYFPVQQAPVKTGQKLGSVKIMLGEEVMAEYSLVSKETVKEISYQFCLCKIWRKYLDFS